MTQLLIALMMLIHGVPGPVPITHAPIRPTPVHGPAPIIHGPFTK